MPHSQNIADENSKIENQKSRSPENNGRAVARMTACASGSDASGKNESYYRVKQNPTSIQECSCFVVPVRLRH